MGEGGEGPPLGEETGSDPFTIGQEAGLNPISGQSQDPIPADPAAMPLPQSEQGTTPPNLSAEYAREIDTPEERISKIADILENPLAPTENDWKTILNHSIGYFMNQRFSLQDAQDLAAELVEKLFARVNSEHYNDNPIRNWRMVLPVALENKRKDALRRVRTRRQLLEQEELPYNEIAKVVGIPFDQNIEEEYFLTEKEEQIRRIINTELTEAQRDVLMRKMQGWSNLEIAVERGVEEGTIKSLVHRAREKLKKTLKTQEEDK